MIPSRRHGHAVRHGRTLVTSLALAAVSTSASAHAQEQTAKLVKDANRTPANLPAGIQWIEPVGTNVVFPKDSLATGKELWVSDGTAAGTRLLKDIAPGTAGSHPQQGISFGTGASARVAFLTQPASYVADENNPPELDLWVTDGTDAGTRLVFPTLIPQLQGNTFLRAGTTNGVFLEDWGWMENGRELIFSDGTPEGTRSLNPFVGGIRNKFSNPEHYTVSGEWCYFNANGNEVWRSDGTIAGTTMVTSMPGKTPVWSEAIGDTVFTNVVIFENMAAELWVHTSTGADRNRIVPPMGTSWRHILEMHPVGNKMLFVTLEESSTALWTTDGTDDGTRRIRLYMPGQSTEATMGRVLVEWQGAIYFTTYDSSLGGALWRTDGTTDGTILLKRVKAPGGYMVDMWAGGDGVHVAQSTNHGFQLWRTRGTAKTTQPLKGTPPVRSDVDMKFFPIVTPTDSTVYYLSGQETPEEFLVRPKSEKGGTLQLTRPESINRSGIPPHPVGAPPYEILGNSLFEFVNTSKGQELWQIDLATGKSRSVWKLPEPLEEGEAIGFHGTTPHGALFSRTFANGGARMYLTDGTRQGTHSPTEDVAATSYAAVQVGDLWFFSPEYPDDTSTSALLKTDGTRTGTAIVEAADGSKPNRIGNMVAFEGKLYFAAITSGGKRALCRTDGTPAGTIIVKSDWHGASSDTPGKLSVVGGKLHFQVRHMSTETLWQSDGTSAGTVMVDPPTDIGSVTTPAMDVGGRPVFQNSGYRWWAFQNGLITRVATTPVAALGSSDSGFPNYAVAGGKLFCVAHKNDAPELFAIHGTPLAHQLVKDINPGDPGSYPADMTTVGNHIYFTARDEEHGRELWRSDGTEAGTILVADVEPGPTSSSPQGLKVIGNKLYFSAGRRATGRELYSIDLPDQP